MSANNHTLGRTSDLSKLVRAKFAPGMLLRDDDLEQLNIYTRELNRLMFRSLLGCGVICGLVVGTEQKCGKLYVTVGAGLALDCCGDPVYVPNTQQITIDEESNPNIPDSLWVVLCGIKKSCAPRSATCASDEDDTSSVCTRERDGFEIRVVQSRPKCICGCQEPKEAKDGEEHKGEESPGDETACWCADPMLPCYEDHYQGKCGCNWSECSNGACECILLARLYNEEDTKWTVNHSVRRFIRPVLMRDPQVELEKAQRKASERGKDEKDLPSKVALQSDTLEQAGIADKTRVSSKAKTAKP